jgi:hypothetical protein
MRRWLQTLVVLCGVSIPVSAFPEREDKSFLKTSMPTVVMVLGVEVEDGFLKPIASGSGTLLSRDGSILTNHHVVFDPRKNRPFDLFVIGRFQSVALEPELICAGRPSHGFLKQDLDFALLKCEYTVRGERFPETVWPALPVGRSEDLTPGERVWVLGYPSVGGSHLQVAPGLITGWTSEKGGADSRDFMKTTAAISYGTSGGTALDSQGQLIGVPTAFRWVWEKTGPRLMPIGKIGLVRPIEFARELVTQARRGWWPTPTGPVTLPVAELPPPADVLITSRVVDNINRMPVMSAFVMILKPGKSTADVEDHRLAEAALTWGQTNERGEFTITAPLPRGRYGVVIMAQGYLPLAQNNALVVTDSTPHVFDPWGEIRLYRQLD